MELDELKEAWAALDNRLKRNEELKESIILEMMQSKAGKLVNRFVVMEIISVILLLMVLPFCIFWLEQYGGKNLAALITMYYAILLCIVFTFWGVFKIHGLMKFDISKDVSNNILYVNRYNIQLKREKKFFWCFGWPVTVILIVLTFAFWKVIVSRWVLLICAIVAATLFSHWSYKRYDKNIDSILKSLEEIRELKEE